MKDAKTAARDRGLDKRETLDGMRRAWSGHYENRVKKIECEVCGDWASRVVDGHRLCTSCEVES